MRTDEILSRLRERIVAYAACHITRDLAEDIAQEVMLLLHTKYGEVSALEELLPLAFQIARFKIAGAHRKAHRRGEDRQAAIEDVAPVDPGISPSDYVERKETLERLAKALGKLEGRCRQLFRLKLEGKSFAEMRVILRAGSINTIYTWDFRCRKQLLERLGGSWEAEP